MSELSAIKHFIEIKIRDIDRELEGLAGKREGLRDALNRVKISLHREEGLKK